MSNLLFSPITLRSLKIANRIIVAPMCQYSAQDGTPGDWHLMHLGQFAVSGAGLVIVEATGVDPSGRITPGCTGLYSDENEKAFSRIISFFRNYGSAKIGLQLAHAGRKASTNFPWKGGLPLRESDGAWQTVAPSAIPYAPNWHVPEALDDRRLSDVKQAYEQAAERALKLDFDLLEIHSAHGYLLHQFLSPLSNERTDHYGGSLENRMRYPLEVFEVVRAIWPEERPLGVRFSATDWIDGGWDIESSIVYCKELMKRGCDFVDVSSGGLAPAQRITSAPGYQAGFAAEIRKATGAITIAVGRITDPHQAETILRSQQADMISMARGMLFNPRWPWHAAVALDGNASFPPQYQRSHPSLAGEPIPGNPPPPKR